MIIRSTALYAPAIVAPRAAAFILVLLLTRRLGAAEFGFYALVTLIGEMLDMGASNWIRFAFLRSDVSEPRAWRDGLAKSIPLTAGFTLLAALVGLGLSAWMAPGRFWTFFIAVITYVASNSSLRLGLATLQLQGRRAEYSILESLRAAGILASGWIASALWPNFVGVVLANAAVTGAFAAVSLFRGAAGMPPGGMKSATFKARITYGLPIIALTFVSYMVASSDRVFLKLLAGAASVGVYAAAYSLARTPSDIVGNAINQGGFPELMRRHDTEGAEVAGKVVRNAFELMSLLQFTILGLVAGLSAAIGDGVLPPGFRAAAAQLMPIISVGAICISFKAYVFDNIFHATKTNWLQFATYAPAGIATVVACMLLIPSFGALGAALSFTIGSLSGLVSSYLLSMRFVRVRLNLVEFAKAAGLGLVAAGVSRLTWMLVPKAVPALISLFVAGGAAGIAWLAALILLRPEIIASGLDKGFQAVRRRLGGPAAATVNNAPPD